MRFPLLATYSGVELYLKGIETSLSASSHKSLGCVELYLKGIETIISSLSRWSLIVELYLRGIETQTSVSTV